METVLITKLKSEVSDLHLPRLNELLLISTSDTSKVEADGIKQLTLRNLDNIKSFKDLNHGETLMSVFSSIYIRATNNAANSYLSLGEKSNLSFLSLKDINFDSSALKFTKNIETFFWNNCSGVFDFAHLKNNTNMKNIHVINNKNFDITLYSFDKLEEIIAFNNKSFTCDISQFPTTIKKMKIQGTHFVDNISAFSKFSNLTSLDIYNCSAIGDIRDLGNLRLEFLSLGSNSVTGSIENYIIERRKVSAIGTMRISVPNEITFNGASVNTNLAEVTLSWTSSSITYNNVTINA